MLARGERRFVSGPFDIVVKDGLVHVTSEDGEVVWLPSVFRSFCEQGRSVLGNWTDDPTNVIPLGGSKKRG